MSSRKYEKAAGGASFWKKSSTAIPGRPNPSKASTLPSSFQDFDESVSDAWDARPDECDILPARRLSAPHQAVAPVETAGLHNHVGGVASKPTDTPPCSTTKPDEDDNRPLVNNKTTKFERLLEAPQVELEELRKLSWSGIPTAVRSKAWKVLCGHHPPGNRQQQEVIQRKQDEYQRYIQQYFSTREDDIHQDVYRQIHIDIPRMSPVVGLFQQRCVQELFERILYIWAIRHPASGYVQGINDLVTPFFLVFLQDYCQTEVSEMSVEDLPQETRDTIEADSYWCLTKVLDGIQDNYTFAQPGIQLKVKQLEELVKRIDVGLHDHLISHDVVYLQFAFRWMNNLLMRELPIKATIRLWDTYLAQPDGFSHFHLYVCAAFLIHWKGELLKKTDFHTLLMFLQNLPTAKWGDNEINLLVAEAYKLSYLFADAPNHLVGNS